MEPSSESIEERRKDVSGQNPIGKILLGVGLLAAFILLGRSAGGYVPVFAEWVDGLRPGFRTV